MAAVESFISNSSPFHYHNTMVAGSGKQPSQAESQYRQRSRSRTEPTQSPTIKSSHSVGGAGTPTSSTHTRTAPLPTQEEHVEEPFMVKSETSRSSPPRRDYRDAAFSSQKNFSEALTASGRDPKYISEEPKIRPAAVESQAPSETTQMGSRWDSDGIERHGGNTIKVRDLAHIQEFASEEFLSFRGQSGRRRTADDPSLKYEISAMPITDIIEMVAGLLTKITTTNDRQHENLHRPIPPSGDASNLTGLSSSVLAFHGKNVPSITILSYLSRIHKYCPTTYEVFLSLLVYFDRMTERVNADPMQTLLSASQDGDLHADADSRPSTSYSASGSDLADSPPAEPELDDKEKTISIKSEDENETEMDVQAPVEVMKEDEITAFPLSHFFVVDSFNIHRLVIAGVTCASKFFSDVFYTNSRYAKVGGLPLAELNHLELQFLLLNDFRLSVPVEELEAYGTMLVEFYAREVIAQRKGGISGDMEHPEDADGGQKIGG